MALTNKQEMFCREYFIDSNATQAVIRAGYSEKAASRTGTESLSTPDIAQRIINLKSERNERVEVRAASPGGD
ncbi:MULTISPECIES: terminase small subunit [unclassified Pantoea]|uniref:terminase small subunit n=1 Tax=unclassified Pantoea TaxID=2630326 RepID=UPI0028158DCB|nr:MULTISPECIES: terminase small subunit [unclassified Pantoea]